MEVLSRPYRLQYGERFRNEFEAAVAGTFNYRGAKLGLGYFYKNKERDEYTGSKYDAANYEEMGKDTDQVDDSL